MKRVILLSLLVIGLNAYESGLRRRGFFENIYKWKNSDPDAKRNVSQLISSKGYPVENYDVLTDDGFVLSVQRIPNGKRKSYVRAEKKGVVFLQHGLLASAADWVMNFEHQSLGFMLADAGYDVWLGNSRGNTYSRRHVKYSPKEKEFWNFSFDELGEFDLPAVIDFILKITSKQELFYVGHSQGTTALFALLSEKLEYNKKIKLMVGLAPVATVGHITSALRFFVPFTSEIQELADLLGINEFLPNNFIMKCLSEYVCGTEIKVVCKEVIFLLCGTDDSQMNSTRLEVYTSHSPSGTSTQSIIHYAQMITSMKFRKFDRGADNIHYYNQTTPPEYNLGNITAPIALFWSKNDLLADPTDVGILMKNLKSLVSSTCVKNPLFNHLDFVWGIDASDIVYNDVISIIKKYS